MDGMNAKFSNQEPPCYPKLREKFGGLAWEDTDDVVTYAGTIYCRRLPLAPDVMVHELVHVRQQREYAGHAAAYLDRYCDDPQFRLDQELEAYRAQLAFIYEEVLDRNMRERAKWKLAKDLASMYALELTPHDASKLLTL